MTHECVKDGWRALPYMQAAGERHLAMDALEQYKAGMLDTLG